MRRTMKETIQVWVLIICGILLTNHFAPEYVLAWMAVPFPAGIMLGIRAELEELEKRK